MKLSRRIQELQPSPTLGVTARANALRAAGEKVLSLAAGETDFPTPENICKAAFRAIESGQTRYTPSAGIPALREAIRRKYKQEFDLDYALDQVAVCCGAKQCLYNVFQALLDPNSEAIVPAPYWVSYTEQIHLCGARPVVVPPQAGTFAPDLNAIAKAITPRTRVILINSPCNPTGYVMNETEIDGVAELARKHDLVVVSDDIYCQCDAALVASDYSCQPGDQWTSGALLVALAKTLSASTSWFLVSCGSRLSRSRTSARRRSISPPRSCDRSGLFQVHLATVDLYAFG